MGTIVAALAGIILVAAELAAVYSIARRTGPYRWAQGVVGTPRSDSASC